jgi:DNA-binding NarL/FixJ family response regulator
MHPAPQPAAPLRALVVDADDRVRESLAGLLCIGDRVVVVGSAGNPTAALDLVLAAEPDVVILDPRLPEVQSGLVLIDRLRAIAPNVRIIVMGSSDAGDHVALAGRADGFVRKTFRPSELIRAVVTAGSGTTP